jgi:uncharacterized membrane protein YczE
VASLSFQVRGGVAARSFGLLAGLFGCAIGIVAMLEARLGLGSWAVLQQGIARRTPLSFGTATIAVSLVVLATGWILGARIGVGTIADAFLVGFFIDLLVRLSWVDRLAHLPVGDRVALLFFGLVAFSLGSAVYISCAFGGGPRDALMLGLWERTGWRPAVCRTVLEVAALVLGVTLGGTVGIGTFAMAFLIGPLLDASFTILRHLDLTEEIPAPVVLPHPG